MANRMDKEAGMEQQIQMLMDIQAVEKVSKSDSLGFYSRFFVVPKKEAGQWRAILDLSHLNQLVVKETFKMETAELVREHMRQGEWMTSLDLKDAYRHIMIHPAFRKYLRFVTRVKFTSTGHYPWASAHHLECSAG